MFDIINPAQAATPLFKNRNISKLVIYSTVIAAILGQGLSFKSLYLFHLLVIPSFYFIYNYAKEDKRLLSLKKELFLVLALVAYPFVTLLWTDPLNKETLVYLYGMLSITAAFLLSRTSSKLYPEQIKQSLLAAFYLQSTVAIFEFLKIVRYPLSMYSNLNWIAGRNDLNAPPLPSNITTAFFWNPNDFGTYLCLMLPLLWLLHKNLKIKLGAVFLCYFLIITTQSRMAIFFGTIEILTVLALFIFTESKLKKLYKVSVFLVSSLLIISSLAIGIKQSELLSEKTNTLITKVQSLENYLGPLDNLPLDSENRRFIWASNLVKKSLENPLRGNGVNASSLPSTHPQFSNVVSPHFFPLELITNFGIIWAGTLIGFYFFWMLKLYKLRSYFALTALIVFPFASLSMSSCIFALPLFAVLGAISSERLLISVDQDFEKSSPS